MSLATLVVLPIPDHPRTWSTLKLSSTPKTPRAPHRRSCVASIFIKVRIFQKCFNFTPMNDTTVRLFMYVQVFAWSWCMHCAVCFWGKKWGREQSTQMFFRLIMMQEALCSLLLRREKTQSNGTWIIRISIVRQEQGKMNKMKKNKFIEERNEGGCKQSTQMFLRLIMRCMYSLLWILSKKWGREQSTQMFLRLIVAKMSDILIQASCLHLLFHRWDLPLLFLSLDLHRFTAIIAHNQ